MSREELAVLFIGEIESFSASFISDIDVEEFCFRVIKLFNLK